ncbi:hypothetical protein EG68_03632 [Paragonimus skrjabini miyazakii]|uniref:O-acyltransferase n=1 Tax=Paragonimus skrjabini miyazakii TaxID=59628 RepID=A0A8S9YX61_9TREM|nr:hypothetical protein EG68_03632 [Paragonimus skrjabini miyazakii]
MTEPDEQGDPTSLRHRKQLSQTDEQTPSKENHANWVNRQNGKVLHGVVWAELVEETRNKLLAQFGEQLEQALNELVERANHREDCLRGVQWHSDYMVDKHSAGDQNQDKNLPVKVFRQRDSVLTELFQLSHIRTVYHMFIAVLVLFSVNVICNDILGDHTDFNTAHLHFFQYAFGGLREVLLFWIKMKTSTLFIPFLGFLIWCSRRPQISKPVPSDWIFLAFYICYQIGFIIIPIRFVFQNQLPPASTAIVILEQIRMFMKAHAFVRSSAETLLQKLQKDSVKPQVETKRAPWYPDFSHYLYFLFAPTLIYRESYPRTNEIRWSYVVSNLLQVCGCVLLSYYVLVRFCFTEFAHFGRSADYTLRQFILTATATSLPGGLVMLLTFFAALHSWMNAFAEMLRFGDRLFYKDWWNSTTFSNWYRTWNVVVHDWLYTYLYKDFQLITHGTRSRQLAIAAVFWISAAVHEYALCLIFRFFYPVLFVFFTFAGYPFVYLKGSGRGWNVVIWVLLFSGWGQMMCLYSMEWYARKNCMPVLDSWLDFFVPHSWFCQPLQVQA